ncbi:hypothetical protein MTR67_008848 [Solanum verrucosum]|uniref:AAA-type ATPase N-terminal domain-containing protein n=1 Tax=Solanum verrucosum TaxID=315347 RepID=A0AAF0Q2U3_SOLVR|nr:hypothetical protein MTR67_008848 [Solanum verrucosum]
MNFVAIFEAYVAIERYLSKNSSIQAKRLKASVVKDGQSLVLSMDDHEEVTDDYEGAKVWWISSLKEANRPTIALYAKEDENRRFLLEKGRGNCTRIIRDRMVDLVVITGECGVK